eukprot:4418993-Amphidinium_carterae.2
MATEKCEMTRSRIEPPLKLEVVEHSHTLLSWIMQAFSFASPCTAFTQRFYICAHEKLNRQPSDAAAGSKKSRSNTVPRSQGQISFSCRSVRFHFVHQL